MDVTTILKDVPSGEWIALSHGMDRIVSTSKQLDDAITLAKERGEPNSIMMKAHPGLLIPSV